MRNHNCKQSGEYSIEWYNNNESRSEGEIVFQGDQVLVTRLDDTFKVYMPENMLYLDCIRKTIEADIKVETIMNPLGK